MPGKRWTDTEKAKLAWAWEDYLGHTDAHEQIAKIMGRTWESCSIMAKSLGLYRTSNGKSLLGATQIADLFGVNRRTVGNWLYDDAFPGIATHLSGGFNYAVPMDAIVQFVSNQSFWHLWNPCDINNMALREWGMSVRSGWITRQEAAEVLGVTPQHLSKLKARGKISGESVGRVTWYQREDVEAFGKKVGWLHG